MDMESERLLNTAINHHLSGKILEASKLYSKVLKISPDNLTALINQSAIFLDLDRLLDASVLLKHAVNLAPNDVEALNNYGNALQRLKKTDEAIENFKCALSQDPNNVTVMGNLGRALLRKGDYAESIELLEKGLQQNPGNAKLNFINALALPIIPQSLRQLEASRKRLVSLVNNLCHDDHVLSDPLNAIGMTNFHSAYSGKNDRKIQEELAIAYIKACPKLIFSAPHIGQNRVQKKIRVGFVSVNIGNHTIGKLNRALLTGLNKHKFEIFVFCPGTNNQGQDNIIDEIAKHVDKIQFPLPTLQHVRDVITKAKLDILYYTDIGMEPLSYFLAFSRLAPIQCVTWGHPITTGIPTIDYFISSKLTEPEDGHKHYSEKLILLDCFTTDYIPPKPGNELKSRTYFGLSENSHLYICPQSLFKFHPDFDEILGEILRQDSNAEIVLLEGQNPEWSNKLKQRFQMRMPDVSKRFIFLDRQKGSDYLQLIRVADVILDTPHFCGGNTSYEAFTQNKVVVTFPGLFVRSRLTLGLYQQMGITEPIATSKNEYVNIALKYGKNKSIRIKMEKKIHSKRKRIFNTNSALRAHEKLFLSIIKE